MLDRRRFLEILGAVLTASGAGKAVAAVSGPAIIVAPTGLGSMGKAYTFLTAPQIRFIEAATSRLIPQDDLGPGALEADVPYFIDQQLGGAYGQGARAYMAGPWGEESEFQGYQLPLTPAELYRVGIAATDRYSQETYGKDFADLEPAEQDGVLKGLEDISVDLRDVPAATFFTTLLRDTKDGYFSDPGLGGNRDMAGWRLIGYPGVAAVYNDFIFQDNIPYTVEPVSIRTVREGAVEVDHHGHAVHRFAKVEDIVKTTPLERKRVSEIGEGPSRGSNVIV